MGEIFNLLDHRIKKERDGRKQVHDEVESVMEDAYYTYISNMKVVVKGQTIKMGILHMDCTDEAEAVFKDESNSIIDYKNIYSDYDNSSEEEEDSIMKALIYLAPKNIIITHSLRLNNYILYAITKIFGNRVVVKS